MHTEKPTAIKTQDDWLNAYVKLEAQRNEAKAQAAQLAKECRIMLSRIEAILNCDEAIESLCADDVFGSVYADMLRDDKKGLREALAAYEAAQ